MTTGPSRRDLRACGTLLNTLHAEHQGAFTHATLLAKLAHPDFEEGRVGALQEAIRRVAGWAQGLWRREPIFLADGRSNDPEALEEALLLLADLRARLEAVGRRLEPALDRLSRHAHDDGEAPEAALLLAALAWSAYAHENELRGAIHHGETLDDPELAERALEQLPRAEDGLRVLHHLLARLEEPGPPGCDLLGEIHASAAHLPGLYGAKVQALDGLAAEIRELRS